MLKIQIARTPIGDIAGRSGQTLASAPTPPPVGPTPSDTRAWTMMCRTIARRMEFQEPDGLNRGAPSISCTTTATPLSRHAVRAVAAPWQASGMPAPARTQPGGTTRTEMGARAMRTTCGARPQEALVSAGMKNGAHSQITPAQARTLRPRLAADAAEGRRRALLPIRRRKASSRAPFRRWGPRRELRSMAVVASRSTSACARRVGLTSWATSARLRAATPTTIRKELGVPWRARCARMLNGAIASPGTSTAGSMAVARIPRVGRTPRVTIARFIRPLTIAPCRGGLGLVGKRIGAPWTSLRTRKSRL
mmetsp:Transcript_35514/g.90266  ORF Transcript_35514/g.90266 Transcript_35514/m.90266 type:complete len:308 (+) Transcript_35514:620-1543(+)